MFPVPEWLLAAGEVDWRFLKKFVEDLLSKRLKAVAGKAQVVKVDIAVEPVKGAEFERHPGCHQYC